MLDDNEWFHVYLFCARGDLNIRVGESGLWRNIFERKKKGSGRGGLDSLFTNSSSSLPSPFLSPPPPHKLADSRHISLFRNGASQSAGLERGADV